MKKSEIENLSTIEHIRKRPAMYIGWTGYFGLIQYLVYPVATMLYQKAKHVSATIVEGMFQISSDAVFEITDDGGLIKPFQSFKDMDWHLDGCAILNALSEELYISSRTSQSTEDFHFRRGELVTRNLSAANRGNGGTTFTFKPDPEIFDILEVSPTVFESYFRRLSHLNSGVAFSLQLGETTQEFHTENGIFDLFTAISSPYQIMHQPIHFIAQKGTLKIEIVMAYHSWSNDLWWSYINNGRAVEGGTHEKGLHAGLSRLKKRMGLPENFGNGILGVASIHYPGAVWEGCIKARVGNPELRTMVSQLVMDEGLKWLKNNPDVAAQIPVITTFEFPDAWDRR